MKTGDLVVLKSGSAPMVIQSVHGAMRECVWFANGESHVAEFRFEILEPTEAKTMRGYVCGPRSMHEITFGNEV